MLCFNKKHKDKNLEPTDFNIISDLANILKSKGYELFRENSFISLTTLMLTKINQELALLTQEKLDPGNQLLFKINQDFINDLYYLMDVFYFAPSLKLTHDLLNTIPAKIDLTHFKNLITLELYNVPTHLIVNAHHLKYKLQTFAINKSTYDFKELLISLEEKHISPNKNVDIDFEKCADDAIFHDSGNYDWPMLKKLIVRHDNLKHVYLKDLVNIKNPNIFSQLTHLDFSNQSLTTSKNFLEYIPKLRHVNLGFNQLRDIPTFHTLASSSLKKLILRNNKLESLEGVQVLSQLSILDVSNNVICFHNSLVPLKQSTHLKLLKTSGNPICLHPCHRQLVAANIHADALVRQFILDTEIVTKDHLISYFRSPNHPIKRSFIRKSIPVITAEVYVPAPQIITTTPSNKVKQPLKIRAKRPSVREISEQSCENSLCHLSVVDTALRSEDESAAFRSINNTANSTPKPINVITVSREDLAKLMRTSSPIVKFDAAHSDHPSFSLYDSPHFRAISAFMNPPLPSSIKSRADLKDGEPRRHHVRHISHDLDTETSKSDHADPTLVASSFKEGIIRPYSNCSTLLGLRSRYNGLARTRQFAGKCEEFDDVLPEMPEVLGLPRGKGGSDEYDELSLNNDPNLSLEMSTDGHHKSHNETNSSAFETALNQSSSANGGLVFGDNSAAKIDESDTYVDITNLTVPSKSLDQSYDNVSDDNQNDYVESDSRSWSSFGSSEDGIGGQGHFLDNARCQDLVRNENIPGNGTGKAPIPIHIFSDPNIFNKSRHTKSPPCLSISDLKSNSRPAFLSIDERYLRETGNDGKPINNFDLKLISSFSQIDKSLFTKTNFGIDDSPNVLNNHPAVNLVSIRFGSGRGSDTKRRIYILESEASCQSLLRLLEKYVKPSRSANHSRYESYSIDKDESAVTYLQCLKCSHKRLKPREFTS
ncbi:unnamed protein product [Gordionus sp. m RMFG-2023]